MKTTITTVMRFDSMDDLNAWFDGCCTRCCMKHQAWKDCSVCKRNIQYKEIMKKMGYNVDEEEDN